MSLYTIYIVFIFEQCYLLFIIWTASMTSLLPGGLTLICLYGNHHVIIGKYTFCICKCGIIWSDKPILMEVLLYSPVRKQEPVGYFLTSPEKCNQFCAFFIKNWWIICLVLYFVFYLITIESLYDNVFMQISEWVIIL
jgi:hypothetical protein